MLAQFRMESDRGPEAPTCAAGRSADLTDPADSRTDRAWLLGAVALAVAVKVIVFGAACLACSGVHGLRTGGTTMGPLLAWDSKHYGFIARHGYPEVGDRLPWQIAFFPLYPAAVRVLQGWVGTADALLLVANAASLAAVPFLFLFFRRFACARTAFLGCAVTLTFPPAFFLSAGYTEGPFLLGCAVVLWLLSNGRVWPAAIVCGIASALRPTGVALAAVICVRRLLDSGSLSPARRLLETAALGLVAVAGLLAYEAFLWDRYGRWDIYLAVQQLWSNLHHPDRDLIFVPGWILPTALSKALDLPFTLPFSAVAWNKLTMLGLAAAGAAALLRPGPLPRYTLLLPALVFLMTWLPGWGARIDTVPRCQVMAVPLFFLVAWWFDRPGLRRRLLLAGIVVQLCVQALFASEFSRGLFLG